MIGQLALQTGIAIPFPEARLTVNQPTCKEIGMIGENDFQVGSRFLNFSKDSISVKDKSALEDKSDFDIFIATINAKEYSDYKKKALKVLSLMFPSYKIEITEDAIVLTKEGSVGLITTMNFDVFKEILQSIFVLNGLGGDAPTAYNPERGIAEKIAEKFNKRHQILAKMKGQGNQDDEQNVNILSYYISVLAVGERKEKTALANYTVWQLMEEFERYMLEYRSDMHTRVLLAGGKDDEDIENWMKEFHS